jgi:hypothetical protein
LLRLQSFIMTLYFHFFFPMQECNLIFIVHLILSVCDCQRKTYISVSGVIFCQNLKIKKDLPLRSWPPHAPLSRFLIFFLITKKKNFFLNGIKNKKSKKLPHFEVIFYDTCSLKIENRSYRFFKKR